MKKGLNLPSYTYECKIRDNVHGYIRLSSDEMKIIDTAVFQRLKDIKQLGTTYLVYPGAVHTRFAHSLGVMHVATQIFDSIVAKNVTLLGWDEEELCKQRQMLRLVSLLHDIGHPPFSHVGDNLFAPQIQNHERMAGKLIRETDLSNKIDCIGRRHGGFDHREIAGLIEGDLLTDYHLIKQIFSGSILDADRMDYLLRDSLMSGVKYGNFDMDHLIRSVNIDVSLGTPILSIDKSGIHALEEFIIARYHMFIQVYLHKTRRIYDNILERCIKNMLIVNSDGVFPKDAENFLKIDDHTVIQYMKENSNAHTLMYKNREHLKLIYETFPHASAAQKALDMKIEHRLKKEGYTEDIFLIDSYTKPLIKFTDEEDNPLISVIDKNGKSHPITQFSMLLSKMDEPIYLFRIYAKEDLRCEIQEIIRECEKGC